MVKVEHPRPIAQSKVLLVEDHPVVRHGLAMLINDEADLHVCAGAETVAEALSLIPRHHPDIVLVDIALGEESGLDLIRQIHTEWPDLPLLAISMHDEGLYAERALRAGAMGYVMKREAMDKVMSAIRRVLGGEIYVSDKMASRMVNKLIDRRGKKDSSPLESLSDREFEVFNLIAQGIGPTEIAQRLSVSVKTIETHREHVKSKLGLRSGAELHRFAIQWKLDRE